MVQHHQGSMDPLSGRKGSEARVQLGSTVVQNSTASVPKSSGHSSSHFRPAGKTGGRKGLQSFIPGVLQPSLSRSEERWSVQTGHRSVSPEHFYSQREIQNGDFTFHFGGRSPERFRCLSGFGGRLFPCPHSPVVQEVPPFYGWYFSLPVPFTPVWPLLGPSGLHANHVGDSLYPSFSGYPATSVPRRLAPSFSLPQGSLSQTRCSLSSCLEPGIAHQSPEVRVHSIPEVCLRRDGVSVSGQFGQGAPRPDRLPPISDRGFPAQSESFGSLLSVPSRGFECSGRSGSTGPPSPSSSSVLLDGSMAPQATATVSRGHLNPCFSGAPPLVGSPGSLPGSSSLPSKSQALPVYRRESGGMGCPSGATRSACFRPMVSCRISETHQCTRDGSSASVCPPLSSTDSESGGTPVLRQHVSRILYTTTGGHPLSVPDGSGGSTSALVSIRGHLSLHQTPPRTFECPSGQPVSKLTSFNGRMDSLETSSLQGVRQTGVSEHRSVRDPLEPPVTSLCVSGVGSSCCGSGRHVNGVGINLRVCFSSIHSHPSCSTEGTFIAQVLHHFSRSTLAEPFVVQRPARPSVSQSGSTPSVSGPSFSASQSVPSSQSGNAPPSRLEIVKRGVRQAKFSGAVASLVSKARRLSTSRVYDSKWLIFCRWCRSQQVDPARPSIQQVADFLVHLFQDQNLSVSTIKGYRAMLSNTLKMTSLGTSLSSHPVIAELIRSFELSRPVSRSLSPKWNLSVVLSALTKPPFEPLGSASFRHLSWKTVFLLTLALAKRKSEIHALSVGDRFLRFNSDGSVSLCFQPGFLAKNQLPSVMPTPMRIPSLSSSCGREDPDRTLCPVRSLKFYLRASSSKRGSKQRLWVPLSGSGDISSASISRWIKATIKFAYDQLSPEDRAVHQVRAHELRALASSWAFLNHAPLDEVLLAAFWRSATTFSSFYLRDVSSESDNMFSLGPVVAAQRVVAPSAQ